VASTAGGLRIDEELLAAVRDTVGSGWWSAGPRVSEFEKEFSAYCGAGHALAVSSGTAALHLAILALGCGPGHEVVLPSLSFVAAANVVAVAGARPVFCDVVGGADLNLSPADLEAAIGRRQRPSSFCTTVVTPVRWRRSWR
jgi:dTDP-4-amino-4,6-dideoxygalactose transaminase